MHGNQSVVGYWLTGRLRPDSAEGAATARIVAELVHLADSGRLRGVVRHALALEQAAEAHRVISSRRTVGKVVLTM